MAYISQQEKKELAPAIKAVLKKYGVKGSIAINHHSSLVVNIKSGVLDFLGASQKYNDRRAEMRGETPYNVGGYLQVNTSWCEQWMEEIGETKIAKFYGDLIKAMKGTRWYNNSDIMTDYFDYAYYIDINVGKWNKDYVLENNSK
jgi:hypothetical protein